MCVVGQGVIPAWWQPPAEAEGWPDCPASPLTTFLQSGSFLPTTELPAAASMAEVVPTSPSMAELGPAPDLTVICGLYAFLNQTVGGHLRTQSEEVAWNCRLAK